MDAIQEEPMPCAEHQAVHQDVARHREDILSIYDRLRKVETEQEVSKRVQEERYTNLEGRMDERIESLKEYIQASMARIEGLLGPISAMLKDHGQAIAELKAAPGKRAMDRNEKIGFEVLKFVVLSACAAVGGWLLAGLGR